MPDTDKGWNTMKKVNLLNNFGGFGIFDGVFPSFFKSHYEYMQDSFVDDKEIDNGFYEKMRSVLEKMTPQERSEIYDRISLQLYR